MRLVIDLSIEKGSCQHLHAGHHLIRLIKNMVAANNNHEIYFVLNAASGDDIDHFRDEFEGVIPQTHIVVWTDLKKTADAARDDNVCCRINNAMYEAVIADLDPDIVWIPSLSEEEKEESITLMACGAIVLTEGNPGLSSIIVNQNSVFDARDGHALASKINGALYNELLYTILRDHLASQGENFSWHQNAACMWKVLETLQTSYGQPCPIPPLLSKRLTLAFVSPLPPEKTGIADYSAELLPELQRHYDITVISDQEQETCLRSCSSIHVRNVAWFYRHAGQFDRVIYQMGNSPFHEKMVYLLENIPGVVVLHDFFLSDLMWYIEAHKKRPEWTGAAISEAGWKSVFDRVKARSGVEATNIIWKYPCNIKVLQQADGVIVHSAFSRHLAQQFYGPSAGDDWALIPHLRRISLPVDRLEVRKKLGIPEASFLVCSFGGIGEMKLNHRLLEAWLASPMAQDPRFYLIFVGENSGHGYGKRLLQTIKVSEAKDRIITTGWADEQTYHHWLAVADMAVQLRTTSRGETSGTVLHCMSYGIPTIVNANGPMAELPQNSVWMLEDDFKNEDLLSALNTLINSSDLREQLGKAGRTSIGRFHNPQYCADLYRDAIEHFAQKAANTMSGVIKNIRSYGRDFNLFEFSKAAAKNVRPSFRLPRIFIDVSAQAKTGLHSGIERVTCSILYNFFADQPKGWVVEPVYASADKPGYRCAQEFMSRFLGISDQWAEDIPMEAYPGDVFLGLDFEPHITMSQCEWLLNLRRRGVSVYSVVHDLLPVSMPDVFPPDGPQERHQKWLQTITLFDGALCGSRNVADELSGWLDQFGTPRRRPFELHWFHHGADLTVDASDRSSGTKTEAIMKKIKSRVSFLMVGSIEPRKGYLQTMQAFELLWKQGIDVNLVIVGREGWKGLEDSKRRDIPETIAMLQNHPDSNKRLVWLKQCSDAALEQVYECCQCLISSSYGEGYGLPLVEAARHGLPLLLRDLPVFREVTAGYATFFADDRSPETIAQAVVVWLKAYEEGKFRHVVRPPVQTWRDAKNQVQDAILGQTPAYRLWTGQRNEDPSGSASHCADVCQDG